MKAKETATAALSQRKERRKEIDSSETPEQVHRLDDISKVFTCNNCLARAGTDYSSEFEYILRGILNRNNF